MDSSIFPNFYAYTLDLSHSQLIDHEKKDELHMKLSHDVI